MSLSDLLEEDLLEIVPHSNQIAIGLYGSMLHVCNRHGGVEDK